MPATLPIYVTITGLRPKSIFDVFRFYRHAVSAFRRVHDVPGLMYTAAKNIRGRHHTVTVWRDRDAMRRFHAEHDAGCGGLAAFSTGKRLAFRTDEVPGWDELGDLLDARGADIAATTDVKAKDRRFAKVDVGLPLTGQVVCSQ